MTASDVSVPIAQTQEIPWWLILIQGVFSVLIGLLLLISPGVTTFVLVQFLGFYWLISGIFGIVSIFIDSSLWGWKLFAGILGILAGIAIIQNPLWSTLIVPGTLVIILGVEGIIIGVVNLIMAFGGGGWGIAILGALSILFGILLVANPLIGAATLVILLGILGLVGGIGAIIYAFRLR